MRHAHILCIATESIFTELILALKSYLRSQDFEVTYECAFKRPPQKPYSKDMNIVLKAQRPFDPDELPNWSCKVLFQSEQYAKLRHFNSMPYSKRWDLILDVFNNNVLRMKGQTFAEHRFFPIGYHEEYHINAHANGPSKLNCYFFGARTKSRVKFWNEIIKPIAPNSRFANTDIGFNKYVCIVNSKINLFIPGWEPYLFPTMHAMQVLANQKFLLVISDTPQDYSPYQIGFHFALTNKKDAPRMIKKFLNDENARHRLEDKMFADIKTKHRFVDYANEAFKGFI